MTHLATPQQRPHSDAERLAALEQRDPSLTPLLACIVAKYAEAKRRAEPKSAS